MFKTALYSMIVCCNVTWATTPTQPQTPSKKPKTISVQEMLIIGQPNMRLHALSMISQGKVKGGIDDSYLPGLTACSKDKIMLLRSVSARIIGKEFVDGKETPNPKALTVLKTLAKDPDADVRFSAVYYGLVKIKKMPNDVVDLLIDIAAENRNVNLYKQVVLALRNVQPQTTKILDQKFAKTNSIKLFEIYEDLTGKPPVQNEKLLNQPSSRPMIFIFKPKGENIDAEKKDLIARLKKTGLREPDLFVSGMGKNQFFLLKTLLTKDRLAVEKNFSKNETFKLTQQLWLTPSLEIQFDKMRKK